MRFASAAMATNPRATLLCCDSLSLVCRELGKSILKVASGQATSSAVVQPLKFRRLSHFRIGLICTLAAVNPKYRDLCVASMRDLVVEEVDFNEKAKSDAWIKSAMAALSSSSEAAASGEGLHAVKCVFDILNISSNSSASETIISSIVDLAFMLIDTVKKDSGGGGCFGRGKSAAAATTAEAGRALLKRIFDGVGSDEGTLESIRKSIIKKVRNSVGAQTFQASGHRLD